MFRGFWHLNKVKGKLNWPFVLDLIFNTKISEIYLHPQQLEQTKLVNMKYHL